jgi:hypothetical protein
MQSLLQVQRGEALAAFATLAAAGQTETLDVDALFKIFKEVFRKGNDRGLQGSRL